jgi:hypothetical protein
MGGPAGGERKGKSRSGDHRTRDWMLSRVVLGAVIVTAISTTVSVLVTRALEPDTEAVLAAFQMAQDARTRFDAEISILAKTKDGPTSAIYLHLIVRRQTVDMEYEHRDWRKSQAAYASLSQELGEACTAGSISVPGVCAAAAASAVTTPSPGALSPVPSDAPTRTEQETPNHPVNTFQNYHAPAVTGPSIAAGMYIRVSCKVYDPAIPSVSPDGYWYRIASRPWNNAYFAPANTFMNGDSYGGPYTHNTDFAVPNCPRR